jgi:hypothetical protein
VKSTSHPDRLVLSDSPGCFWLFGGFFCLVGGGAVAAASASQNGAYPAWQVAFGIVMGLVGLGTGLYLIYDAPASRVILTRHDGMLTILRRGIFRRVQERFALSSVSSIYLVQGKDIDGDPVFTLRMELQDGRETPLTHLWIHNRERLEQNLAELAAHMPRGPMRRLE